ALDLVVAIDGLADAQHLVVAQLVHPLLVGDADLLADVDRERRADAVDVAQRDHDALVGRDVHAGDALHVASPQFRNVSVAARRGPEASAQTKSARAREGAGTVSGARIIGAEGLESTMVKPLTPATFHRPSR